MNCFLISLVALGCIFGGAVVGLVLRRYLPVEHLSGESKEAIRAGTAMVATLTALVLALLINSAKDTFNTATAAVTDAAAKLILLDRSLARYGEEAGPLRELLRKSVAARMAMIWSREDTGAAPLSEFVNAPVMMETIQDKLWELRPETEAQRALQGQSLQITNELLQSRWLTIEQSQVGLPKALLVVLIFWLTILFVTIGLLAPPNTTVVVILLVCALSVSGAVFLIGEMSSPWEGRLKVSGTPLLQVMGAAAQY